MPIIKVGRTAKRRKQHCQHQHRESKIQLRNKAKDVFLLQIVPRGFNQDRGQMYWAVLYLRGLNHNLNHDLKSRNRRLIHFTVISNIIYNLLLRKQRGLFPVADPGLEPNTFCTLDFLFPITNWKQTIFTMYLINHLLCLVYIYSNNCF